MEIPPNEQPQNGQIVAGEDQRQSPVPPPPPPPSGSLQTAQDQQRVAAAAAAVVYGSAAAAAAAAEQARVLKVEDALTYLDEVKRKFGDQPQVYNTFLNIMKEFKAETIDTPGVIAQVSNLFRGHNELILGFNTFLPPGYRIESSSLEDPNNPINFAQKQQMNMYAAAAQQQMLFQQRQQQFQIQQLQGGGGGGGNAGQQQLMMVDPAQMYTSPVGGGYQFIHPDNNDAAVRGRMFGVLSAEEIHQQEQFLLRQQTAASVAAAAASAAQQQGQPVEFDHAINYVTKIKRRFANDAETYRQFLEILHTYQKESKSIKEVLDQVSELFRDHSDLLKEFTYFLPDAVRDKAKAEINRITARRRKEEQRKEKKIDQRNVKPVRGSGNGVSIGSEKIAVLTQSVVEKTTAQPLERREKSKRSERGAVVVDSQEDVEEQPQQAPPAVQLNLTIGKLPRLEKRLFARIKSAFGTRERWGEFLKCLDLFSQEILSRAELVALCTDMFGGNLELLEEFDRLLASRGATDDVTEDAWFSVPLSEVDFSQSRRCTPSYRSLPANYPKPPCSERTELCRRVLNDTWVAIPSAYDREAPVEDGFTFKTLRKNNFEKVLFSCEDDRYELDMIIGANMSTIQVLESLSHEVALQHSGMSEGGDNVAKRFALDRRSLSIIHLKSIARVYGDRADECFELLKKAPASAIPIILNRLKSKDEEWRRLRLKMNDGWRDVVKENYLKSLDHRGYYQKSGDKKLLTTKNLLVDLKDFMQGEGERKMSFEFADASLHRIAAGLIACAVEKNSKEESGRCLIAFECAIAKLLNVKSLGGKSLVGVLCKVGSKVLTRYGVGVVSATSPATVPTCEVRLAPTSEILTFSKESLCEATPLTLADPNSDDSLCFIGQSGYAFVRFYHVLCERLLRAESLAMALEREPQRPQAKHVFDRSAASLLNEDASEAATSTTPVKKSTRNIPAAPQSPSVVAKESIFESVLSLIRRLVREQIKLADFESELVALMGLGCYFLFSIDKIVFAVAKAVMGLVNEDKSVKVFDALNRYNEKRTAVNAADMYQLISDALATGNSCAAIRSTFVTGSNPIIPSGLSAKRLGEPGTSSNSVDLVADELWEKCPRLELEFSGTIPQNALFGSGPGGRSLSPIAFDPDGSVVTMEMGELEFASPRKVDMKRSWDEASSNGGGLATRPTRNAALAVAAKSGGGINGAPAPDEGVLTLSIFKIERVVGSDDVFRKINAHMASSSSEGEWWKSSSVDRREQSPAPGDSFDSSNEDGAPPPSKRTRTAVTAGNDDSSE